MAIAIITPPSAGDFDALLPIAELRRHCVIGGSDSDGDLRRLARTALELVEVSAGVSLLPITLEWTGRCFPSDVIRLPRPPLLSVSEITWRDASGATQTIPAGDYETHIAGATVEPGTRWPTTGDYPDAARIVFMCGYLSPQDVPMRAVQAIMALCSYWFENREAVADADLRVLPLHARTLLRSLRGGRLEEALS